MINRRRPSRKTVPINHNVLKGVGTTQSELKSGPGACEPAEEEEGWGGGGKGGCQPTPIDPVGSWHKSSLAAEALGFMFKTQARPRGMSQRGATPHKHGPRITCPAECVGKHTGNVWTLALLPFPRNARIEARNGGLLRACLLYTSPSPRDVHKSRMPSSA